MSWLWRIRTGFTCFVMAVRDVFNHTAVLRQASVNRAIILNCGVADYRTVGDGRMQRLRISVLAAGLAWIISVLDTG